MLAGLAVPLGQGYLFGRPGPRWCASADRRPAPVTVISAACSTACRADPRRRPAGRRGRAARRGARPGRRRARSHARPIGLLAEGGGWAHRERPLTASVQEPAIGVARRALSRSAGTRLDPVCACLPDGRFAGLVGVERLLGIAPAHRTRRSCFPPASDAQAQAPSPTRRSHVHDVPGDGLMAQRSAHQLVEFLTAVSAHERAEGATAAAAELAAAQLDAEVGAAIIGDALAAATRFGAVGLVHAHDDEVDLPGLGRCWVARAERDADRRARLVVARRARRSAPTSARVR